MVLFVKNAMKPINFKMVDKSPDTSFLVRYAEVPHTYDKFHYHEEFEILYNIENEGTRFVGDSIRNFKNGDLVMVGPHIPHYWLSDDRYYKGNEKLKARVVVIQFLEDFLGEGFIDLPEMRIIRSLFDKARFGICFQGNDAKKIGKKIFQVYEEEGWKRLLLFIEALCLMGESKEFELLSSPSYIKASQNVTEDSINRIFNYLILNHQKEFKLDEVASHFNMNPSAFCRYFKKSTSRTLSHVLNEIRIGFACKKMINTDKSISEICYDCGYMNVPYFNRVFKRLKGVTPNEYRQKHLKV
jgi:AraC-like DNA-binding protein